MWYKSLKDHVRQTCQSLNLSPSLWIWVCEDILKVCCTERMFKNSPENYFSLKQWGGRLLKDGSYVINYGTHAHKIPLLFVMFIRGGVLRY